MDLYLELRHASNAPDVWSTPRPVRPGRDLECTERIERSVIEAYRAVAGFAAWTIGLLICVSEFTDETSVTSPARTHAANGKRVFTGRVPTIFNMAILPRCARIPALRLIFPELKTLANAA